MINMLSAGDYQYIRERAPDCEIPTPTAQQSQLIMQHFRGQTIASAARSVGMEYSAASYFLNKPGVLAILQYLREREFNDVRMDRETLTSMFLEAYNMAGTAMEKIAATRELGKLHGLYLDGKNKQVEVTHKVEGLPDDRKLKRMSHDQLLALAQKGLEQVDADEQGAEGSLDGEYERETN